VGKRPGRGEPGPFDVANFRRRERGPAIEAAAVTKPATTYDLRSTFASNALAAGITTFALARIMGTSAKMIEQHYGTLIDTTHDAILTRLDGFGAP
jgi:integrase